MARFVKFGEFEKLELGMPVDSSLNEIHGGQLESATAKAGDALAYGTKTGQYTKNTNGTKFAGVLAGDRGRMNLQYGKPSDEYVKGNGINVMTRGYIAVTVDTTSGIKEGDAVKLSSSGVFTKSEGTAINAIFTGETTGDNIAGIKLL